MDSIYSYSSYRDFISRRFEEMPKKGYGQSRRLAEHLGVHTTLVSQVLKGIKTFTHEQAALACEFLGLTDSETDFFLMLVQIDRASNSSLRKILNRQIENAKQKSAELVNRLHADKILDEETRNLFYSDWVFSAVRQLMAIKGFQSIDPIADRLQLTRRRTKKIIQFLLQTGLCTEKDGKFQIGHKMTHIESTSPWVRAHHINWRHNAIERLSKEEDPKLNYTCPLTISKKDTVKIQSMITKMLEEIDKIIESSPSEELFCLNIDWFRV